MYDPVQELHPLLRNRNETICTVESCSGGIAATMLSDPSGASDVFAGGFVTYSNAMKTSLVDVPEVMIEINGAVSAPVAIAMAKGGLAKTGASHALSITGIAGPGGGTDEKPVGTVWICRVSDDGTHDCRRLELAGDREWNRKASATMAICILILHLKGQGSTALPNEQERL
jgi:PncC family amidohydrolase